jgi:pyridoxamine 5'-phosphate oxidase-like protein
MESINLDAEEGEIPWSRAADQLGRLEPRGGSRGPTCWLTTTRADGRPHVAGVVGFWDDGTLFFVSGPRTIKAKKIARDPRCSFAISLPDLDLVLDGTAERVTDPQTLDRVAQAFAARGWPLEVEGDLVTASFGAPTAPPPPWHLHAFEPHTALGVATAAPSGATRWRFK